MPVSVLGTSFTVALLVSRWRRYCTSVRDGKIKAQNRKELDTTERWTELNWANKSYSSVSGLVLLTTNRAMTEIFKGVYLFFPCISNKGFLKDYSVQFSRQASLSIATSRSLLKLMSIESVMPSNHLILCWSLLPLSVFPSIRVFSNESVLHIKWPKYWSFSFSISPSNEYSGLISFRMDWLDLLAVQGTLKSLLQHHSSKASILQHSPFFIVQLSHPHMTTGKTIALTRQTFVGKVMSLPFNMCCLGWS